MMVRVIDNTLRASLMMHLIEQLERGDLSVLLEKGVCPKTIDRLRGMSISDLLHLASSGHPDIHFTIDENGFDLGVEIIDRRREETEHLAYFTQNGASQSMIYEFFPTVDRRVIQTFRNLMKNPGRIGRVSLPDENVRDLIHKCWHGMNEEYPGVRSDRERLIVLHGFFNDFTLDVLYATVNEFRNKEKSNDNKK